MGRIVAIGGGELNTTHSINKYIVDFAKRKIRNFFLLEQPATTQKAISLVFAQNLKILAVW